MIKKNKNAFCIIHFGDKKIYLEYEIYTIIMLKKNIKTTKNDIIYLYSINDTPEEFVKIIKGLDVKTIGYDDKNITYDIEEYKSAYEHFNTLRTCNFLFAFKLTEYKKICIIESDMIIMKNLDPIFNIHTPAILYFHGNKNKNQNTRDNFMITNITKKYILDISREKSLFNGGVLVFEPSLKVYKQMLKNIKIVVKYQATYPNETLYAYTFPKLYNLPIKYNMVHYYISQYYNIKNDIVIYHFNNTKFKPLDIIKDDYLNKNKRKDRIPIVKFFKKNYYDKYHTLIEKIMETA